MSHKYFTINERNKLEVLLKENYKISKIAQILNKYRATILRTLIEDRLWQSLIAEKIAGRKLKGRY